MKKNHWGIWIDSEVAITGVVTNNHVEWLNEEIDKGINLDYEEFVKNNIDNLPNDVEDYEWSSDDTILIGDWFKNSEDQYEPDPNGEYSAIVRESVTQVVLSKRTKRCALCSPCYPGQGDLDTPGEWLAYDLPREIYGSEDQNV